MSTEQAGVALTIIGMIGTVFNVWLTWRIRADMSDLKVWAMEKFMEKGDVRSMVQTYLSQERSVAPTNVVRMQ